MNGASVMIVGLGDLGARTLTLLAAQPNIERIVVAARSLERAAEHVNQARLVAAMLGGPGRIDLAPLDLEDRDAAVQLLRATDPEIIVMAASRVTWWRSPAPDQERAARLARLPYGAWLPVQASLVRRCMEAWRAAGVAGTVLSLPFPDGVGPVLRPLGLAPHAGAGNITEDAAKLQTLAARDAGVARVEVDVCLVLHHAAERITFPSFGRLAGDVAPRGEPPWHAEIHVRGTALPVGEVERLFRAAYPRPQGVESQTPTAAAAAHLVRALLSGTPVATHAPSPGGLPGGYPVAISRAGIQPRMCGALTLARAIEINRRAARWDGIQDIEADGTIVFTEALARAAEEVLGLALSRVPPADLDAVAERMLSRALSATL